MTEQKSLGNVSKKLSKLIQGSHAGIQNRHIIAAKNSFADYVASAISAKEETAVLNLANNISSNGQQILLGQDKRADANTTALFNGFLAHYLDYDDVQENFRGHPGVVIYSALLSLSGGQEETVKFFESYVVGVEVAGKIGQQINPEHKTAGYHTTATIGTIAAAAALAYYKNLPVDETNAILSFAATQAMGLGIQAGTDTKPLHAGLAAQRAVQSYGFVISGLSTHLDVFNNENGWVKTLTGQPLDFQKIAHDWLRPGEIINPGIWYKNHQYCSAAMSSYDAARSLWKQGVDIKDVDKLIFHFRPNGDKVLQYERPRTGQEGKFSPEYITWQVLAEGDVDEGAFKADVSTEKFLNQANIFDRKNDLLIDKPDQREVRIECLLKSGQKVESYVHHPKGSPVNPLSDSEMNQKFERAVHASRKTFQNVLNQTKLEGVLQTIGAF